MSDEERAPRPTDPRAEWDPLAGYRHLPEPPRAEELIASHPATPAQKAAATRRADAEQAELDLMLTGYVPANAPTSGAH